MPVSATKFNVITNCTSRKSAKTDAVQLSCPDAGVSLDELAAKWVRALRQSPQAATAATLYQGRAFSDAKAVVATLSADLYVVSAGLGLVHGKSPVPHYNLTVATGTGSIAPLLKAAGFANSDWWKALVKASGNASTIHDLVSRHRSRLTLIALPASYLAMVGHELEALTDAALERVRIFTSPAGSALLSTRTRSVCLPYDDRLEGSARYAGTKADFPQRAMRHFVECVQNESQTSAEASKAVNKAMASFKRRIFPDRERRSDDEILCLLADNWNRFNGHQAPLLRFLRDEALVSCEQSRFSALWRQAKSQQALQ